MFCKSPFVYLEVERSESNITAALDIVVKTSFLLQKVALESTGHIDVSRT